MMNEKSNSYLVRLEGQKIVNITTDLASTFALKATKNEIVCKSYANKKSTMKNIFISALL